jgi:hypothetical protein
MVAKKSPRIRLMTKANGSVVRRTMRRVALFGVADLPGFVDFLAGRADVGGGCFNVLVRNLEIAVAAVLLNLAAFLRGIVFVGEAAFRGCPRRP